MKIDINRVDLTPCQVHKGLQNMLLGGAEDEHLSCFYSSCQLGLSNLYFMFVFQSSSVISTLNSTQSHYREVPR